MCRVSHPALTSGYAHPKDGRLPIDQLDPAWWLVPKKRGLTHPPFDHPTRDVAEEWFYLFLLFPKLHPLPHRPAALTSPLLSSPLLSARSSARRPNREKNFPAPAGTFHPCANPLFPSLLFPPFILALCLFFSRKLDAGNASSYVSGSKIPVVA